MRSLYCSPEGIKKAKRALIRYSLTQKALAEELEVTRQPIGKFFTGKPVDRNLFVQICERLDLEWEEVVAEAVKKPGLLEYLTQQFSECGVTATQVADLFNQSRALFLFDGLDEVREEDNSRVLKEIRDFSDLFRDNHFVMTCRIAARQYTFEKFTEVEIADFDDQQIEIFATKWFLTKNSIKVKRFLKKLDENKRIKELATNPLLLTLLCLVFGEKGKFKENRSELYEEGLELLLERWDDSRDIERDQIYKKLSTKRKEDLLSKVAFTTFKRGDYFFKQKQVEGYIIDYIRNLPDAQTNPEVLQLDSKKVLKSIEAQHGLLVERARGIYSFSHLTFHEYFTAREIVFGTQPSEKALLHIIEYMLEKRWREVFLLAVGMSPSADSLLLLMKQKVEAIVALDEKLQSFLVWLNQKSLSAEVSYKPAAIRAFYFGFNFALASDIDLDLDRDLALAFAMDLTLPHPYKTKNVQNFTLAIDVAIAITFDVALALNPDIPYRFGKSYFDDALNFALDTKLRQALIKLKKQQDDYTLLESWAYKEKVENWEYREKRELWWQLNGKAWTEQLRTIMIEYRDIGQDWQFNNEQKEALKQYNDANKLLVDCLNSDCYVSREVRQEIEDTLLLPIAEIEKRKQSQ